MPGGDSADGPIRGLHQGVVFGRRTRWASFMCGIGGVVGALSDPKAVGGAMARHLDHRGPDGRGVALLREGSGGTVGVFAHTRLKVIDLTEAADQPFEALDGKIKLTFNGEIYNFRSLRARLQDRGVRFRSSSDTEVILAQYLEHGEVGLNALDGMFAFAIWDGRYNRLILARDRLGKKPLYWVRTPDSGLAFASEAKALREVPGVDLDIDPDRVPEYLTFGYVQTPRTIFRGVRRLEPASRLVFTVGGHPQIKTYWSLWESVRNPLNPTVPEALGLVRDAMGRAVERRLVADVPIGAFLSGGIDSSVVVAEMAARASGRVRTFAVGFDDDATYDETEYARGVARQFGTEHTEIRLAPRADDVFDQLLYHHDEPYGDSSALAVHAVAEATRRHVTVVLTGDGGDEVFAGYTRFLGGLAQSYLPSRLGLILRSVLERFPEPRGYKHPVALVRRFVEYSDRSPDEQLLAWNAFFAGPRLRRLLRKDVYGPEWDVWSPMCDQLALLRRAREAGCDRLGQILAHNLGTYLLDDLLVKTDRMTMAVGLEARSPFLDTELVQLAFRLPSRLKMKGGRLKWLLREAYRGVLGPEVLDRRKHGFGVPLGRWWSGPLRPLVHDLLERDSRIHALLDAGGIRELVLEHQRGLRDHGQRIFALVQLELFMRGRSLRRAAA